MLRSLKAGLANYEATQDKHDARQDHFNRRQTARNRRYKKPATASTVYGYVCWDWSTNFATDSSQCELCNADGSRITTPTLGWVNTLGGPLVTAFGDGVYFLLIKTGTKTILGVTRDLYVIQGVAGLGSGTLALAAVIERVSSGMGKVEDKNDAVINTTINGSSLINFIPFYDPNGATNGYRFDLGQAPQMFYGQLSGVPAPAFNLEWRNGRHRIGSIDSASGTGVSIDFGEQFHILWYDSKTQTDPGASAATVARTSMGRIDFVWRSGTLEVMTGLGTSVGTGQTPGVNAGRATTVVNSGYTDTAGTGAPITMGTAKTVFVVPATSVAGTWAGMASNNIQVTVTQNVTTGRITAVSLTQAAVTGVSDDLLFVVYGGRESNWPKS